MRKDSVMEHLYYQLATDKADHERYECETAQALQSVEQDKDWRIAFWRDMALKSLGRIDAIERLIIGFNRWSE